MIPYARDLLAFDSSDLPGLIAFLLITVLSGLGGLLKKKKEGELPEILEDEVTDGEPAPAMNAPPVARPTTVSKRTQARPGPTQPTQLPLARRASEKRPPVGRQRVTPTEHAAQIGYLARKQTGTPTKETERQPAPDRPRRLTPRDLRRAIVLREIIGPPVSLRDPLEDLK